MMYLSDTNPHTQSVTETLLNRYTEKAQDLPIHMLYLKKKKKKAALI